MSAARLFVTAAALLAATTVADARIGVAPTSYLQCVPYARQVSGVALYGDAHTWWDQARGRYARGKAPKVGAVMAFRPYAGSRLGHVAAVSKIIDERTILIKHANWSERGRIETNVRVIDVSPDNDWSAVRVWNGKSQRMGGGSWPLYGFIYNEAPGRKAKPARPRKHADRDEARLAAISGDDAPLSATKRVAKPVKPVLAKPMAGDPIGAIIARSPR